MPKWYNYFMKGHHTKHTEESKRKMSASLMGRKAWNKGTRGVMKAWNKGLKSATVSVLKGKKLSEEHKKKLSDSHKGKPTGRTGEKCPLWKGGITPINKAIRMTLEYRLWREAVFKRDNYTCVWCGDRNHDGRGETLVLNADHIKPFSLFPELRFSIDNGRTLCVPCHKTTGTWGRTKQYRG